MNGQTPWGMQEFQMQEAVAKRQREQQLAEALQQQQLSSVANPLQGAAMILREFLFSRPQAEKKDAALSQQLQQFFAGDEQRRQQEMQQAEMQRQREREEGLQDYGRKQEIKAANRAPQGPLVVGGALVDPATGRPIYTAPEKPEGPTANQRDFAWYSQLTPEQRQAFDAMQGRDSGGDVPSGYRRTPDGNLEPTPGGPADKGGRPNLTAEAAAKLALYENALREAQTYRSTVVGDGGEFHDFAARMPESQRAFESAIRAKLRAESGAVISQEEVKGETGRYGPRLLSSDATNVEAVDRMIADLQHQIGALRGSSPAATTQPPAAQAQGGWSIKRVD